MKRFPTAVFLLVLLAACKPHERTAANADASSASAPRQSAAETGVEVGFAMPAYSAPLLDGSNFDVTSRRGKVVLLNLWATWCPPCRYEIPELQRLHDAHASRGLEVVGVSVDETSTESVRQFVAENRMTYPIVHDSEGRLASLLQSTVLPTSLLLDRHGKIVWKKYGAIMENDAELQKALDSALQEQ